MEEDKLSANDDKQPIMINSTDSETSDATVKKINEEENEEDGLGIKKLAKSVDGIRGTIESLFSAFLENRKHTKELDHQLENKKLNLSENFDKRERNYRLIYFGSASVVVFLGRYLETLDKTTGNTLITLLIGYLFFQGGSLLKEKLHSPKKPSTDNDLR